MSELKWEDLLALERDLTPTCDLCGKSVVKAGHMVFMSDGSARNGCTECGVKRLAEAYPLDDPPEVE